jgi:hypothetical protein
MFDAKMRRTTRRGRAHTQRCEDESLVFFYNQIAVLSVFDGCSDGDDSYFASGLFAKILKKIAIQNKVYFESLDENSDLESVMYTIMDWFFNELKYSFDYLKLTIKEALSTIAVSVVNIKTKNSYSVIIGDGSVYVDGMMNSIKPKDNAPDYITYYLTSTFFNIWNNNVYKYSFKIKNTIAVLTDGIDSFKDYNENRYLNSDEKKEVIYQFFESGYLLDNKIGLARICNILDGKNIAPSDDLSIAHITFVEIPE